MHVNYKNVFNIHKKYQANYNKKEYQSRSIVSTKNDEIILCCNNKSVHIKGLRFTPNDSQKIAFHRNTKKAESFIKYSYNMQLPINIDPHIHELIINGQTVLLDSVNTYIAPFEIKNHQFIPPKFNKIDKTITIHANKNRELKIRRIPSSYRNKEVYEIGYDDPISFTVYIDRSNNYYEYTYHCHLSKSKDIDKIIDSIKINNALIDGLGYFDEDCYLKVEGERYKQDIDFYKKADEIRKTLNIEYQVFYDELHSSTKDLINQIYYSLIKNEPLILIDQTIGSQMIDDTDLNELNRIYNEQSFDEQYTYQMKRDYERTLFGQTIKLVETLTLENARLYKLSDTKFIFINENEDVPMKATSSLDNRTIK